MRKSILKYAFLLFTFLFVFTSCKETGKTDGGDETIDDSNKIVTGTMVEYDDDKKTIEIDLIEWVTLDAQDRINELGLSVNDDMPSGFYIHKLNEVKKYNVADSPIYEISQHAELNAVNVDVFMEHLALQIDSRGVYELTIEDDKVIKIMERYVP